MRPSEFPEAKKGACESDCNRASLSCVWVRFFRCVFSLAGFAALAFPAGLPEEGVSRDLARDRALLISNVRYGLKVELKKKAPTMPGHIAIQFDLKTAGPLILDYRDGVAGKMKVNGTDQAFGQQNGHLTIPGANLHAGANQIDLDFESGIATANRAITRVNDTQDGAEYLYTLFVPMDASQAFPCFDQPDLKARFTLEVNAPPDWKVISNGPSADGSHFEQTKPISTYLFAFAAGPFEEIAGPSAAGTPLRLFVRHSQAARGREEWPRVSGSVVQGITRMSDYLAQPFPFPKYDEVLIPGFPYGGMEHAGATFLNEDTILFRTVPTANDYNRREITVLHELAHQWFGDLVTMRWFNDLWLKEGFAQYMAYHTQAEMQPSGPVWKRFYESIKPAAYQIDGTHGATPIYQQIPNLKDAKSAYGAIVYEKAPSLLRLLSFNIGEDASREGIRTYLREHAYANAEWSDLIGAYSRASKTDLIPWADAWIKQRGMPQVETTWTCSGKQLSSLRVTQRDDLGEGHVWPVKTQILLGYKDGPAALLDASFGQASASVPGAAGKVCPDYVFGNNEDHAYGRFLLDLRSQKAVVDQLPGISDPFLRALLWGALWDNVRDLRMTPAAYADFSIRMIPEEKNPESSATLLARLREDFTRYLSDTERAAVAGKVEDLLIGQIQTAATPDLRITYFRSLIGMSTTTRGRDALKEFLAGRMTIPEVPIKQRDRWNIIAALTGAGDPSAAELLDAESRHDTTDEGRKYAWVSAAGVASAATKTKYFADYLTSSKIQEDWITASLGGFNRWNQTELTEPYLKQALDALPQMKRERKIFFVNGWLSSFVDNQHSATALKTVDNFLAANRADPDLRLKILEVRDELAKTVRIRAAARAR